MLQFGLRLGGHPRQLVTTTPRPVPLLKELIADAGTRLTRISTLANAANLAPGFIDARKHRYGGTRLGRQELDAELIEDREDALWRREMIEAATIRFTGELRRVVVAVDPPAAAGAQSCCGIAGLEASRRAVVLADCSVQGASPAGWASVVVRAYRRFSADRVVAEINLGGDMVASMLKSIDESLPVSTVRATCAKYQGRTGCRTLRTGARCPCRALRRAGRPDVRLRPGRAFIRPFARPAGCAGLGADGTDAGGIRRTPGEGCLKTSVEVAVVLGVATAAPGELDATRFRAGRRHAGEWSADCCWPAAACSPPRLDLTVS